MFRTRGSSIKAPGPARWPGSRKEIRSSSTSSACARPLCRVSEDGKCVPPPGSSRNSMLFRMFRTICSILLCPTSRCICCLILERATCGLEAKKVQYSSARFHAAISRIDSPSVDISPNIPTVGAFNSYSLSLSWNGVAPGTLVSNFFARAS